MQLEYKNKTYTVDKQNLSKIVSEAFRELQNKEIEDGGIPVSGGVGFFAIAMQQGIPTCMACGSFDDYSGSCYYTSQITEIKDGSKSNRLCQAYDIPLVHAIEQGRLDSYILKEVKNGK